MIDPLLSHTVAAGLALLLVFAAWHKLSARDEFTAALRAYELLPDWLLGPVARLLPALEVALALAWLTGLARGAAAVATAVLLLVYAAAVAINLRRGRVHISCGCGLGGATDGDARLSWWLVARNAVLAVAAAAAALPVADRELGLVDSLTLVLAILASVLLYAGASQLMRNGAAIASWRTSRE
jgi:hypothetical protein